MQARGPTKNSIRPKSRRGTIAERERERERERDMGGAETYLHRPHRLRASRRNRWVGHAGVLLPMVRHLRPSPPLLLLPGGGRRCRAMGAWPSVVRTRVWGVWGVWSVVGVWCVWGVWGVVGVWCVGVVVVVGAERVGCCDCGWDGAAAVNCPTADSAAEENGKRCALICAVCFRWPAATLVPATLHGQSPRPNEHKCTQEQMNTQD